MKLSVTEVKKVGGWNEEYVSLKVLEDTNLVYYMLSDTTFVGDKISNKLRHTFWFPHTQVRGGDFIRVYTRPQRSSDESSWSNKEKTTTHIFYWGLRTAVWNDSGDAAVLFELSNWTTKKG